MLGLMRSAAVELATSGVTVNAVMPGNVETPGLGRHERGAPAAHALVDPDGPLRHDPEDVGWAVRFLASPEAGYITGPDADRRRRPGAARRRPLLTRADASA